jgi:L-ascorbate oxidase
MKAFIPLAALLTAANAALVEYTWNVRLRRSRDSLSPDCFTDRDLLLVNDMNPGPVLRANVGDTVRVTVINHSPTEAISIHYHGLSMMGQPYSDGTGTVSQCSTGPMQTAVNEFVVMDVGTHYWHGHTSLDRLDGLQGAIVIDDPNDLQEQALKEMYDDEVILFLQDWYHRAGASARAGLDSEPFIWIGNAQSFLINGMGYFDGCGGDTPDTSVCTANCSLENQAYSLDVEEGKTYRLRIINAASLVGINLAIAGHNLTVVEADGTITEPLEVPNLDVTVAQRYSVLLKADQAAASYWGTTSIRHRSSGPMGQFYVKYGDSEMPDEFDPLPAHPTWDDEEAGPELDSKLFTKDPSVYDTNDVLSVAAMNRSLVIVGTQVRRFEDNLLRWAANNVSMQFSAEPLIARVYEAVEWGASWPDTDIPGTVVVPDIPPLTWNYTETLQDEGVSTFNGENGVSIVKLVKGDVVDLVLQNARALNGVAEMHAWHLHGQSFWVIGQGFGTFDPATDPANYNLVNPLRRDTVTLWPNGWTAIRFKADNVGVWPFHCTMNAHSVMGMGFSFITSPDMLPPIPPGSLNCFKTSVAEIDAEQCQPAFDPPIYPSSPATDAPSSMATPAPVTATEDNSGGCIIQLGVAALALTLMAVVWM